MDENKDKQIQRLFDDYADSLDTDSRLADRARNKMRQSRERKRARKRPWWLAVAAGSVAFVALVLAMPFLRDGYRPTGNMRPTSPAPVETEVKSYGISDVRAMRADADFASDYIATALDGADIFSADYYACYIKATGEFVYMKAILGVACDGGALQICVVAEKSGYAGTELAADYQAVMSNSGRYKYTSEYVYGEYITTAYFQKSDVKYYVTAYGNVAGGQNIVAELIGAKNS